MQETTKTSTFTATHFVAIALIVALLAMGGYAWREHSSAQRLTGENQQMSASLKTTQAQLNTLAAKVDALSQPPEPKIAKPSPVHARKGGTSVARHRADDPHWKAFQAQLDSTRKDIDSNRQDIDATRRDLAGARTELGDSIARTHEELVVLQRKGERSFYEFDLDKAKGFHNAGPVGVRLRKSNDKHQYADLDLMVDDADLTKKHVNLLEPVVFYAAENGRPVELVINSIRKNHIHGYVSEPKYKNSDLVAAQSATTPADSTQASANAATAQAPARPRQKLTLPKD